MQEKFDFNDILIVPSTLSRISTRKDICPYTNDFLPLITAPMDTVVSLENKDIFYNHKINLCLPRGINFENGFVSYSLNEINQLNNENLLKTEGFYLIDIANGHMLNLVSSIKEIKLKYPKITLMVGNIANPETYVELSEAGADLIRVGIGNGGGCSTTVHTGIGFPMASLIQECYYKSLTINKPAKIVADGGMQNYSDIIKALALGADYVMLGNILNKSIESSGDNYLFGKIKINHKLATIFYDLGLPIYKKFRGMSTKEVQKKWGKETLTTSEGVVRFRKVEYRLDKWIENFEDYLRSAMSYSDAYTLDEFIGKANIIRISDNAYNRFKK